MEILDVLRQIENLLVHGVYVRNIACHCRSWALETFLYVFRVTLVESCVVIFVSGAKVLLDQRVDICKTTRSARYS